MGYAIEDGSIDHYTDRFGCGDELRMDQRFRSALILGELWGDEILSEGDDLDGHGDDTTSH